MADHVLTQSFRYEPTIDYTIVTTYWTSGRITIDYVRNRDDPQTGLIYSETLPMADLNPRDRNPSMEQNDDAWKAISHRQCHPNDHVWEIIDPKKLPVARRCVRCGAVFSVELLTVPYQPPSG